MISVQHLLAAFALLSTAATPGLPDGGANPTTTRAGHLKCGDALITSETQVIEVRDQANQILAQTLSLKNTHTGTTTTLVHDGRLFQQPFLQSTSVLDASATGWACIESTSHTLYLYIVYTCVESPARPHCAGTRREWPRLFDTAGRPLGANLPHASKQLPALMRKLGLANYLIQGVSLNDIDD
jgi:hypothetical protein